MRKLLIAAILTGTLITPTTATGTGARAKAVSLSDARTPPTVIRYMQPTESIDWLWQCGSAPLTAYWSNVSAYRWNGGALGPQRWNRDRTITYWRDKRRGGKVTFNGITITNKTNRPVLFAGWCD